ncbi:MAG: hypothetical protein ABH883_07185 [Candidatus Omnitrophota bacterium]
MKKYGIFFRSVSILLCAVFIEQQIGWAETGRPVWIKPADYSVSREGFDMPKGIEVPYDVAKTQEAYDGGSEELIIQIQDAHASLSAQHSIASLLNSLVTNYNLSFVALEGASGYVDTSILKTFPHKDIRNNTAEYLMREGRMSAGEFFSVTNDGSDVSLFGVENDELYNANLNAFRNIAAGRAGLIENIDRALADINKLENMIYSKELAAFNKSCVEHRDALITFPEHWKAVSSAAKKCKIDITKYSDLSRLIRSIELEKEIDFEKANDERADVVDRLSGKLDKAGLEVLVLKSLEFKENKISQKTFYTYIVKLAEQCGIPRDDYLNISRYISYVSAYSAVDLFNLYREIEDLEQAIRGALYRNEEERGIYRAANIFRYLRKLYGMELTNDGYGYITANRGIFSASECAAFLRDKSHKYGVVLSGEYDIEKVFSRMDEAIGFYSLAASRDEALVRNTVERMREHGKKVGALITGGFHTRGLTDLLQKKKLSYMVIIPKFENKKARPYIAVLTNKKTAYEKILDSGKYQLAVEAYFQDEDNKLWTLMTAFIRSIGETVILDRDARKTIDRWLDAYENRFFERERDLGKEAMKGKVSPEAFRAFFKGDEKYIATKGREGLAPCISAMRINKSAIFALRRAGEDVFYMAMNEKHGAYRIVPATEKQVERFLARQGGALYETVSLPDNAIETSISGIDDIMSALSAFPAGKAAPEASFAEELENAKGKVLRTRLTKESKIRQKIIRYLLSKKALPHDWKQNENIAGRITKISAEISGINRKAIRAPRKPESEAGESVFEADSPDEGAQKVQKTDGGKITGKKGGAGKTEIRRGRNVSLPSLRKTGRGLMLCGFIFLAGCDAKSAVSALAAVLITSGALIHFISRKKDKPSARERMRAVKNINRERRAKVSTGQSDAVEEPAAVNKIKPRSRLEQFKNKIDKKPAAVLPRSIFPVTLAVIGIIMFLCSLFMDTHVKTIKNKFPRKVPVKTGKVIKKPVQGNVKEPVAAPAPAENADEKIFTGLFEKTAAAIPQYNKDLDEKKLTLAYTSAFDPANAAQYEASQRMEVEQLGKVVAAYREVYRHINSGKKYDKDLFGDLKIKMESYAAIMAGKLPRQIAANQLFLRGVLAKNDLRAASDNLKTMAEMLFLISELRDYGISIENEIFESLARGAGDILGDTRNVVNKLIKQAQVRLGVNQDFGIEEKKKFNAKSGTDSARDYYSAAAVAEAGSTALNFRKNLFFAEDAEKKNNLLKQQAIIYRDVVMAFGIFTDRAGKCEKTDRRMLCEEYMNAASMMLEAAAKCGIEDNPYIHPDLRVKSQAAENLLKELYRRTGIRMPEKHFLKTEDSFAASLVTGILAAAGVVSGVYLGFDSKLFMYSMITCAVSSLVFFAQGRDLRKVSFPREHKGRGDLIGGFTRADAITDPAETRIAYERAGVIYVNKMEMSARTVEAQRFYYTHEKLHQYLSRIGAGPEPVVYFIQTAAMIPVLAGIVILSFYEEIRKLVIPERGEENKTRVFALNRSLFYSGLFFVFNIVPISGVFPIAISNINDMAVMAVGFLLMLGGAMGYSLSFVQSKLRKVQEKIVIASGANKVYQGHGLIEKFIIWYIARQGAYDDFVKEALGKKEKKDGTREKVKPVAPASLTEPAIPALPVEDWEVPYLDEIPVDADSEEIKLEMPPLMQGVDVAFIDNKAPGDLSGGVDLMRVNSDNKTGNRVKRIQRKNRYLSSYQNKRPPAAMVRRMFAVLFLAGMTIVFLMQILVSKRETRQLPKHLENTVKTDPAAPGNSPNVPKPVEPSQKPLPAGSLERKQVREFLLIAEARHKESVVDFQNNDLDNSYMKILSAYKIMLKIKEFYDAGGRIDIATDAKAIDLSGKIRDAKGFLENAFREKGKRVPEEGKRNYLAPEDSRAASVATGIAAIAAILAYVFSATLGIDLKLVIYVTVSCVISSIVFFLQARDLQRTALAGRADVSVNSRLIKGFQTAVDITGGEKRRIAFEQNGIIYADKHAMSLRSTAAQRFYYSHEFLHKLLNRAGMGNEPVVYLIQVMSMIPVLAGIGVLSFYDFVKGRISPRDSGKKGIGAGDEPTMRRLPDFMASIAVCVMPLHFIPATLPVAVIGEVLVAFLLMIAGSAGYSATVFYRKMQEIQIQAAIMDVMGRVYEAPGMFEMFIVWYINHMGAYEHFIQNGRALLEKAVITHVKRGNRLKGPIKTGRGWLESYVVGYLTNTGIYNEFMGAVYEKIRSTQKQKEKPSAARGDSELPQQDLTKTEVDVLMSPANPSNRALSAIPVDDWELEGEFFEDEQIEIIEMEENDGSGEQVNPKVATDLSVPAGSVSAGGSLMKNDNNLSILPAASFVSGAFAGQKRTFRATRIKRQKYTQVYRRLKDIPHPARLVGRIFLVMLALGVLFYSVIGISSAKKVTTGPKTEQPDNSVKQLPDKRSGKGILSEKDVLELLDKAEAAHRKSLMEYNRQNFEQSYLNILEAVDIINRIKEGFYDKGKRVDEENDARAVVLARKISSGKGLLSEELRKRGIPVPQIPQKRYVSYVDTFRASVIAALTGAFGAALIHAFSATLCLELKVLLYVVLSSAVSASVFLQQARSLRISESQETKGAGYDVMRLINAFQNAREITDPSEKRISYTAGKEIFVNKKKMADQSIFTQRFSYLHELLHAWGIQNEAMIYLVQGILILPVLTVLGMLFVVDMVKASRYNEKIDSYQVRIGIPAKVMSLLDKKTISRLEDKFKIVEITAENKQQMLEELKAGMPVKKSIAVLIDITPGDVRDAGDMEKLVKHFVRNTRREVIRLLHPEITALTSGTRRKIADIAKLRNIAGILVRVMDDIESLELSEKSIYQIRLDKAHTARVLSGMKLSVNPNDYAREVERLEQKYLSIAVESPAELSIIANGIAAMGLDKETVREAASKFIQVRVKAPPKADGSEMTQAEKDSLRDRYMKNTGLGKYLNAGNVKIVSAEAALNVTLETVRQTFPNADKNSRIVIGDTRSLTEQEAGILNTPDAPIYVQMTQNEKGVMGVASHLLYAMLEIAVKGKDINNSIGNVKARDGFANWYILMPRIRKIDYKRIQEEMKMYNEMLSAA